VAASVPEPVVDASAEVTVADVHGPDTDSLSASSSDAQCAEGAEVVETGYVNEKPMLEGTKLYAAEQEITRQIAQANLQRVRAQYTDARKTLRAILQMYTNVPSALIAPAHELLGDLDASEQRWETALGHYRRAHAADPKRASSETKVGKMTVQIADEDAMKKLGLSVTPQVDVEEAQNQLAMATGISLVLPGAGHLLLKQFNKGLPLLAAFITAVSFSIITLEASKIETGAKTRVSKTATAQVAIGVAIFVYAGTLMDLMAQSKRKQVSKGINPVPAGDPKDWDI
jgi:tetratricopeptide (TPR) repeat protein